ncbi:MAG: hypothetical protein Q9160_009370 [Pyrenula sp. 1 TL-2023]
MADSMKPILVLSRENHREWFPLIQSHLQSKDADWILNPGDNYPVGITDAEKRKARGIVRFAIQHNINWEDRAIIAEEDNVRKQWEALRLKYKDAGIAASERAQEEFFSYRLNVNKQESIDHAWSALNRLATRIRQSDEAMTSYLTENRVFKQLLTALPPSYSSIRDTIRSNPKQSVDVMLDILYTKERELYSASATKGIRKRDADDAAYLAKGKGRQQNMYSQRTHRRRDSSSSESSSQSEHCFLCSKDHFVKDCSYLTQAQAFVKGLTYSKDKQAPRSTRKQAPRRKAKDTAYLVDSESEFDEKTYFAAESAYPAIDGADWTDATDNDTRDVDATRDTDTDNDTLLSDDLD